MAHQRVIQKVTKKKKTVTFKKKEKKRCSKCGRYM